MLTVTQIAAIIMLLTAFGVDPIITADVQRILEGRPAITSATTTTMTQAEPQVTVPNQMGPSGTTVQSTAGVGTAEPVSKARIDIINHLPKSGLNRPHSTSPELDDGGKGNPKNVLDIGAVVYDQDGEPTRSAVVTVSVISPTTEEVMTINGTGAVTPIYPNGQKRVVPVYMLHYEFKTAGEHTITFSANGVSQSVTVQVSE